MIKPPDSVPEMVVWNSAFANVMSFYYINSLDPRDRNARRNLDAHRSPPEIIEMASAIADRTLTDYRNEQSRRNAPSPVEPAAKKKTKRA